MQKIPVGQFHRLESVAQLVISTITSADDFQIKSWQALCLTVYISGIKSTCSVSSQGLLTKSLTFSLTLTVFQSSECSNSPRDAGYVPVINAPLPQSLTSTRATLPVWYTSSQIGSSPLLSHLWCNRTWYRHFSQDTYPLFISSNKVLCVSRLQRQLNKCAQRFWGQHRY